MGFERKHLIIAAVFGLACALGLFLFPRALAILSFYFGFNSLKELFFARLGMSAEASDLLAGFFIFFFPMATYFLSANIFGVLTGKIPLGRLIKIFGAYAFVYLLPTGIMLIHDSIGGIQCFDQRTGAPRLFYSIEQGGLIVLSSAEGFDRFGIKLQLVTQEVCRIADRQRNGIRPKKISPREGMTEFFDPAGGGARVFYSRGSDGKFEFFDGPGVNPLTNEILLPVTPNVVDEFKRSTTLQEQQRLAALNKDREEAARKALKEREAADRGRRAAEALQKQKERQAIVEKELAESEVKKIEENKKREQCENVSISNCTSKFRTEPQSAVDACKLVTYCEPDNPRAWSYLGRAGLFANSYDIAKNAFNTELSLANKSSDNDALAYAYMDLGRFEKIKGTYERSESFLLQAIQITDQKPSMQGVAYNLLSSVYFARGNNEQAEIYLKRAVSLLSGTGEKSTLADSYAGLAQVSIRQKNPMGACYNWRLALAGFKEINDFRRLTQTQQQLQRAGCW